MTWYYVDAQNGNDSNDGSYYHPFKTLALFNSLFSSAQPGDRFRIRPTGIYTERILISGIAVAAPGIVIEGDPDYGSLKPIVTSNNAHGVLVTGTCSNITVKNLELRLPTVGPASTVTCSGTTTNIVFDGLVIKDAGVNGVLFSGTNTNPVVRNCIVTNAAEDGIGGDTTNNNFLVEYCIVDKCGDGTFAASSGDGISWHDNSNGIIRFNTIRRCSKGGITNVQNGGNTISCFGNFLSDCAQWTMAGHQNGTNTIGDHIWVGNVILMADTAAILVGGFHPRGMMLRGRTDAVNTFTIYNNVIVNCIPDTLAISIGDFGIADHQIKALIKNNIFYSGAAGTGKHIWIGGPTWWTAGTLSDYNAFSANSGQMWAENVTGYNFAQWQAKVVAPVQNIDSHSAVVDPLMVNEALFVNPGAYVWSSDANRWPVARAGTDAALAAGSLLRNAGLIQSGEFGYPDFNGNFIPNRGQTSVNLGAFFGLPASGFPAGEEGGSLNSRQSSGPPEIASVGGRESRLPKSLGMPDGPRRIDLTRTRHPVTVSPPKRMR